jgi:hypothetical protein
MLALIACDSSKPTTGTSTLRLHPCVSRTREVGRCGTVYVPENRDAPDGRTLALRVMVLPARGTTREREPLVFFNGGPGSPTIAYASYASWALSTLRETHDLVLVDVRHRRLAPLTCHLYEVAGRLAPYLAPMFRCRSPRVPDDWRNADLKYNRSHGCDFDAVRAALHVDQIDLYGAPPARLSLGTCASFPPCAASRTARRRSTGGSAPA